jgi:hypothetical protein
MDPVRQLWSQANFRAKFTPPNILYAFNKTGEKFIVINDHKTIYRIMNAQGQVFMVAHFRCKKDPNNQYYTCDDPIHIVSCTKYTMDEDQYANDVIIPAVFPKK